MCCYVFVLCVCLLLIISRGSLAEGVLVKNGARQSMHDATCFANLSAVVPCVVLLEWTSMATSVLYDLLLMFDLDWLLACVGLGEHRPCISAITALLAFPFEHVHHVVDVSTYVPWLVFLLYIYRLTWPTTVIFQLMIVGGLGYWHLSLAQLAAPWTWSSHIVVLHLICLFTRRQRRSRESIG
jgi:hypothetical protein